MVNPAVSPARFIAVCVGLAALVAALYFQTAQFEFVAFDDGEYVRDNPWVNQGFSWDGVRWALLESHAGNWHPLTWLSHILDCQLFGARPGPPHVVNAALHAVSAAFLFALLAHWTGAVWRPALAAALFAVHPLRAESVAWVSERKDALSLTLGLATLLAYAWYTKRPNGRRYLAVAAIFTAGLMAKQLLVTLPVLMLLLDYWKFDAAAWRRRVAEKLPLLGLAAAAGVLTLVAQNRAKAISGLAIYSLGYRLQNAVVAYAMYVKKFLWPTGLAFVYPHRGSGWPAWQVLLSAACLVALTLAAVQAGRRGRRALLVGWLWFLTALVPNLGIIQAGAQALADRYSYLSGIGLAIIAAWGLGELVARRPSSGQLVAVAAVAWLAVLVGLSYQQIGVWRNTTALVDHALAVDRQNYVAHKIKGTLLAERGDNAAALDEYRLGAQSDGRPVPETLTLMATALAELGDLPAAEDAARQALGAQPSLAEAHIVLGKLKLKQGDRRAAVEEFRAALKIAPDFAKAHANLASVLADEADLTTAMTHAQHAVRLAPRSATFVINLGVLELRSGQAREALQQFRRAAQLAPQSAEAHYHVGLAQAALGDTEAARVAWETALKCDPNHAAAHFDLGRLHESRQQWTVARRHYGAAVEAQPNWLAATNNMAWLLATCPDAPVRDGGRAVQLAEASRELTPHPEAGLMDTLAAAYAEAGRWPLAVETARGAIDQATKDQLPALADELRQRLALYEMSKPYRQPSGNPAAAKSP